MMHKRFVRMGALLAVVTAIAVPVALSAVGPDSADLRTAVTLNGVRAHQLALDAIAAANGGTRVDGTAGYQQSVDYVVGKLQAAGYTPQVQTFTFDLFEETAPPVFARTAPSPKTYVEEDDFATMEYSGTSDVTAGLVPTNDIVIPPGAQAGSSNSGCEAADYPAAVSGKVALVQRGTCTFREKADLAKAAGAVAVVIFNEGQPDRSDTLFGTLSPPQVSIPVIGTSFTVGEELYNLTKTGAVTVHVKTTANVRPVQTSNVLADTAGGRSDRLVVVGAHLDSVPGGPGINDNGSGTAAILEVAEQMAALNITPRNKVRFAFWGGEEFGLLGAQYYVDQLNASARKNHMVNLNFDMVGSPNFVRFVYDGDGSATGTQGPNGSKTVEQVFLDYFASQGLATAPTAFDGRSDYGPFIDAGIPAGGLFTGAEGIKTAAEAALYGGTAGAPYDPCYHQACDTAANNSNTALDQMSDAIAHSVLTFALTTSSVNGTDNASDKAKAQGQMAFKGSKLKK